MKKKSSIKLLLLATLSICCQEIRSQVLVGANAVPKSYSVLELVSEYKTSVYGGLRLPQMTTAERTGLETALTGNDEAKGLMIFNTTDKSVEFWNGSKWVIYAKE